jgi:hypothetical protein
MQALVGKSVREVADALHTPESQFDVDDDEGGYNRSVFAFMIGPPYGRILRINVSQQDAIVSTDHKVRAAEFFDKRASGIEVYFCGTQRDICVGDAKPQYLKLPESTYSSLQLELYHSCLEGVGENFLTLYYLDRDEPLKAHETASMDLTIRLDDLHKLAKDGDNDQGKYGMALAHLILKNADEHREQSIQDKYSLQIVIECKNLVTNSMDIQRASELEKYLAAASTNQVLYPTP